MRLPVCATSMWQLRKCPDWTTAHACLGTIWNFCPLARTQPRWAHRTLSTERQQGPPGAQQKWPIHEESPVQPNPHCTAAFGHDLSSSVVPVGYYHAPQQQQQQQQGRPPGAVPAFSQLNRPQSQLYFQNHHQKQHARSSCLPWPASSFWSTLVSLPYTPQQLSPSTGCGPASQVCAFRGVKTLIPYDHAPKPLPRMRRPEKGGKLHRMVIRVPPLVDASIKGQHLELSGKAGAVSLDLTHLDPTGLLGWQVHLQQQQQQQQQVIEASSSSSSSSSSNSSLGSLLLLVSPSKRYFRGIQSHINNAVHGVSQGYLVGLTVKGVGYRMEPVEDAVVAAAMSRKGGVATTPSMFWELEAEKNNPPYPYNKPTRAVRFKVGFTKAAIYPLPEGVLAFFIKPTLMYLYGVDKQLVHNTAARIRAVRKPNVYTGNGIQLVDEVIKLRQRAGSK